MTADQSAYGPFSGDRLRAAWRWRSRGCGWSTPGDWWVPAVDALIEAVGAGHGLAPRCELLGRARARSGVTVGEAIADLGALFAVLDGTGPPLRLVRAVADGWAAGDTRAGPGAACVDPLTGLVTLPYLHGRLAELYREAAAGGPPVRATHRLVLVEPGGRDGPWWRLAQLIVMGRELRRAFTGGETLCRAGTVRAAVLTPLRPELECTTAGLRRTLDRSAPAPGGTGGARVWTVPPPDRYAGALAVLGRPAP